MILVPDTLLQNRYLVVRLIAQGGMGAVYKATDQQTKKTVALKQSLMNDPHLNKAFEREARMLSRLRHPVLPTVSDHFVEKSGQFLVMEFIPGDDLGTLLQRQAKKFLTASALPWVLSWAEQLLDALDYLHRQEPSVIHRDIKPQNLKLTSRGEIRLLDFGLAKSLADQTKHSVVYSVRGYTPQYASLEQIQGTGTDPRSDLYALGATLYHLMTGKPAVDALERVATILTGHPDPLRPAHEHNPLISPNVSAVIQQSLELDKEHRFATAHAMRTALNMASQSGQSTSSGQQTIVVASARVAATPTQTQEPDIPEQSEIIKATTSILYRTLIVEERGQGHYQTIGAAIKVAQPGMRILIRPGIYREGVIIDKQIECVGDGTKESIVIESTGQHTIQMQTDYALIRGLTIRCRAGAKENSFVAIDIPQGRLVLEECDVSSETRTGVAIHGQAANPILWKCRIHTNRGTGILFYEQARGIVDECEIVQNGVTGIGITQQSRPIIRRCTIQYNKQGGLYFSDKACGFVEECTLSNNERVGIEIKQHSNPLIQRCTIQNQTNGYGLYIYQEATGTIEACDISNNSEAGIGITHGGSPFIRTCAIHHEKQRGIVFIENAHGIIEDCDIFQNVKVGISIGKESNPIIRQSTIRDGEQGGILIMEKGAGIFEECMITNNNLTGVEIRQHGNPVVRRCVIKNNQLVAIHVHKNGTGIVEECDLTENKRGAWSSEAGSMVLASGNRE